MLGLPPCSPLFPYTTLFRSGVLLDEVARRVDRDEAVLLAVDDERPGAHAPDEALRSEEHTSELQSRFELVCRLLLEKKKANGPCQKIDDVQAPVGSELQAGR